MDQQQSSATPTPGEKEHFDLTTLYINRELSWIDFNLRVFEEAKDSRHPLLERVKFISIFETNLDEFIMIRLAGLKDQAASSTSVRSPDGLKANAQLKAVRKKLAPILQDIRQYWRTKLVSLLAEKHINIFDYEQLDAEQLQTVRNYFENEVFPVLTPLAVDSVHPFPHISNRSLNLAVVLTDSTHGEFFARVKIPPSLPRLVPVHSAHEEKEGATFVWMEQIIAANLHLLFPGFEIWESYPFRVLRDADIELQEDDAADLLEYIEQEVRERRFGMVVDLAINPSMPAHTRQWLIDKLEITSKDVTTIDGPLGMGDVIELLNLVRPELKDPPFTPRTPSFLQEGANLFAAVQKYDLLLHHPYDSFNTVVDFIRAAANDPQVLAIKQTLYRVGKNSPIVNTLLEAVENGKQVAVLVELKARFDEENNIGWAKQLEEAGVHVAYGLKGLKTHAKIALVVRREEQGLRRYIHLGTGNYNATTARIYEDLCLITCQPEIGIDAGQLFNALTGYSLKSSYNKLLVAPLSLRRKMVQRIEREIELHNEYGHGRIIFKMNSLTDPEIINMLYRASQTGVSIELIIRGICCLRPGVEGISETIRVRSIVGRFLEHSRIYYFHNHEHPEILLGSADMMQRNLDNRIETLFPLDSLTLQNIVFTRVLQPVLADTVNAHELHADGTYTRILPKEGEEPFDSQSWFISHPLFEEDENDEDERRRTQAISILSSNL